MTIGTSDAATQLAAIAPPATRVPPITRGEYAARLDRARALTEAAGAGALLVHTGASLRYFTGVPWSATERMVALLLPVSGEPVLICPRFEQGSLEADLTIRADLRLWEEDEDPVALVADAARGLGRIAVDPLMPFAWAERLRATGATLVDGAPAIDGCRMVKSAAELACLAEAKAMTLEVQARAAAILHPGIAASEVIRFIDAAHHAIGGGGSFFCAVQFGRATAFPHGLPGDQRLGEDELVLIDTGCRVHGYHSDITRTYAFGEVGQEIRDIWAIEHEAQAAAFAAAAPGVPCEAADAAARVVLERAGLGPDYRLPGLPHRTGHGIGLSIHEPANLVRGDRTPMAPGMCFSNEPMIVVPDRFGVRLEDHFHVTDTGAAWFTEPQPSIDRPFG
ncbi:Xaa-Pro peptidase family protein [Sphingomonas sp. KR1UV-12]|uniref:Xaa-Pro peptidase family protein n=1 Tax=Sphingomonas aurea TaxID=3063994 RepID=A0ABT9EMS7_9SPHN|nr:Xaa-Pro peptidase family protein [Sphingomonas sp. KR1UV-12]MDP1027953.1 Xaa-Pro peptidase family protein [Sphingomonas sp. KR1UV-12]